MTEWDITGPGEGTSGDRFKNSEHLDPCVFVYPTEVELGSGKNKYSATMCDYVICLGCHHTWEDAAITGATVFPRLLSAEGTIVAFRLVEGEKTDPNKNAVILPEELAPPELEQVRQTFNKSAVKMPTPARSSSTSTSTTPTDRPRASRSADGAHRVELASWR